MNRPVETERIESLLNSDEDAIHVRQTHISRVMLTQTSAFKRLKPVQFDFLDFSNREGRFAQLAAEARLNRRLAPGVYRRLVPLWQDGEAWRLEGYGPPDDWMLEMERLPDDATLERCLAEGRFDEAALDTLVDHLATFFFAAPRSAEITANGDPAVLRANLVDTFCVLNAAATEGLVDPIQVARLRSRLFQELVLREDELRVRQREGWIRDGHGDLRAEHVYLTTPLRIVDCIAFNHRLRWIDVADDMTFLATDLARLDHSKWAGRLLESYRERMNDPVSDELLALYGSSRFAVRAKVAVLRGRGQTGPASDVAFDEATRLLIFANVTLPNPRPWFFVVCGLSGTGKSTLAGALSEHIGAIRLSTDVVRKERLGLAITDPAPAETAYSETAMADTYRELLAKAERPLAAGVSVVLDATFLQRSDRQAVLELAERLGKPVVFVECRCDPDVIERRLVAREERGGDASDATVAVWQAQQRQSDGYAGLPPDAHWVIDSGQPVAVLVDEIVTRRKRR